MRLFRASVWIDYIYDMDRREGNGIVYLGVINSHAENTKQFQDNVYFAVRSSHGVNCNISFGPIGESWKKI